MDRGSSLPWPWHMVLWVNQVCVVIPSLGLLPLAVDTGWGMLRWEGWGQRMEGPQTQAKNLH